MSDMIQITIVKPEAGYTLRLGFSNGDEGVLRLAEHLKFVGYFSPLASSEFFAKIYIDHGTLCWPNDIDLDPIVVHAWTMGLPLELASAKTLVN